jgi:putative toxin-antitoxin system antitoxin component (TIGR02293 family)
MKAENKPAEKVYKLYANYLDNEEQSIVSEPQEVYATAFNDMVAVANYDKDFAADLLDVSYKTVTRYQKEKKKLSPLQSEYILKTIALFNKGNKVFGSEESFNRWLDKPAFGLGNKTPRKLITTVGGINYVIDELNRIAHGDLA